MGNCCSCTDIKFFIKRENIEEVMKLLAPTQYGLFEMSEVKVLNVCKSGTFEDKQNLIMKMFRSNGYLTAFDAVGNICSLSFERKKWYEDTLFFDVFAKCVEKGSYIEMHDREGDAWRMVFDGVHCRNINAVITWPGFDELIKSIETEKVLDTEPSKPENETFEVSISQTRYATLFVEAESRDQALDTVSAMVKGDSVSWYTGPLNYTKVNEVKPHLDNVIRSCEDLSKKNENNFFKDTKSQER